MHVPGIFFLIRVEGRDRRFLKNVKTSVLAPIGTYPDVGLTCGRKARIISTLRR